MFLIPVDKILTPKTKSATKTNIGAHRLAASTGLKECRIFFWITLKTINAIRPLHPGEITQLATIEINTFQSIYPGPPIIKPNPSNAPIIAWVVETGHPKVDAVCNHTEAPMSEASIPIIKMLGLEENMSGEIMSLRIVSETEPPIKKAPENSKIAAITIAFLKVSAREPIEVPIALATSLAPMFHNM